MCKNADALSKPGCMYCMNKTPCEMMADDYIIMIIPPCQVMADDYIIMIIPHALNIVTSRIRI